MTDIKKVAVIGAGVMGASIAAHVANAGVPVVLMDIPQGGLGKKNSIAEAAIDRLLKTDPAPFMHKDCAKLITASNTEQLRDIKDCDWIIEAIVEKIDVKQDLYKRLFNNCGPTTIISSNTSTIPLKKLVEGMDIAFQQRFMITHFFNPPRYMRLLELVRGTNTSSQVYDNIADFADKYLGKGVVDCHDTPGFIANRIGTFWLQTAFLTAIDQGITVEEADALLAKPLGVPKTGVFGLMDLVGIDLMPLIGKSLNSHLPADDLYRTSYREPDYIQRMINEGFTGRKGKGGFYCMVRDSETKRKDVLDLNTGRYRTENKPRLTSLDSIAEGLQRFLTFPDKGGRYAHDVTLKMLWYAASLVPEIANDIHSVDTAMKLGYAWKWGPFELMDKLGVDWVMDQFKTMGMGIPKLLEVAQGQSFYRTVEGTLHYLTGEGNYDAIPRRPGVLLLSDIKRRNKPILKNGSAALWDIGDGVACLEFTSKMNALDIDTMKMIHQSLDVVSQSYKAMVIHNEGTNFSVGANLGLAMFGINLGLWNDIEGLVRDGQATYQKLKYAPFPVVAAPSGIAVGGGCEILLHSDAIQAHAELYSGLVEVGVGLIPAWGGCKEMLARWLNASHRFGGVMVALGKVFEMIGTARVAKSAMEAREMMILRDQDRITMNKDRLLADAKQRALELVPGYKPPEHAHFKLPGSVARVAFSMAVKSMAKVGKATAHDQVVCGQLSHILSGGDTDITDQQNEETILNLEIQAFMQLVRHPETWARVEHMLETGKPLRN